MIKKEGGNEKKLLKSSLIYAFFNNFLNHSDNKKSNQQI